MNKILLSIFLVLSVALSLSAAERQLELAVPFSDNMILQRGSEVPIWGVDAPGNQVTVEFARQIKTVVADKNGNWMVKLDPLKISREEQGLEVKNNRGKSISLKGNFTR